MYMHFNVSYIKIKKPHDIYLEAFSIGIKIKL